MLIDQFQSGQIMLSPARLSFDDASERARTERVRGVMKRERNAAAVRMAVVTVAAFLPLQLKTIDLKSGR